MDGNASTAARSQLETTLGGADLAVLVIYLASVLGVGLWASIRGRHDSTSDYFLGGRNMNWVLVGASLFASNVGTDHFVGLAGSGAATGIGIAGFELNALFIVLLLAWVFVPVYLASGVFTMPEYLRKRFGGQRIRIYLALLALLSYVFTKISTYTLVHSLSKNRCVGISMHLLLFCWASLLFQLSENHARPPRNCREADDVTGGLSAVLWIDFVQAVIMIGGASVLAVIAFVEVGGYSALVEKFGALGRHANTTCNAVPENYMHLFRAADDASLPWPGMTIGLTINAIWYWCSDQVIVQRSLSAKNLSHAKAGSILTGYLKILPLFLMVFPGMAARVLFPEVVGCADPEQCTAYCGNARGCTNIAYPLLVLRLMPAGGRGLMMSVMTASLVANLASIFNSASTLFTMDLWNTLRRNKASEQELVVVGRCFVVALVAVSIVWIPVIEASSGSQLFDYIQSVSSFLAPPVCAVYVLAIAWARTNEQGAFWGLMAGLAAGLGRFIWEYSYALPPCGLPDPRPAVITRVHYLHYGCLLFAFTAAVCICVSLLTKPIPEDRLYRLTFWTVNSREPRVDLDSAPAATDGAAFTISDGNSGGMDAGGGAHGAFKKSAGVKLLLWACRAEGSRDPQVRLSPEDEAKRAAEAVHEEDVPRRLCIVNGLVLLVVAGLINGYYA
ncbi:sodium/mannose cotransporter SLC5A10-like isoform X2 [Haemaphysalis longicornis]